jgi:hypothetical protein
LAVSWYSATPTVPPRKSAGELIPDPAGTYTPLCRNAREVNAGIAMNGGSGASRLSTYDDSDISAASNSR